MSKIKLNPKMSLTEIIKELSYALPADWKATPYNKDAPITISSNSLFYILTAIQREIHNESTKS